MQDFPTCTNLEAMPSFTGIHKEYKKLLKNILVSTENSFKPDDMTNFYCNVKFKNKTGKSIVGVVGNCAK